jgi:uncharacterized protein
MEPVRTAERIPEIDLLRGFALLGILVANMPFFSFPITAQITGTLRGATSLDRAADLLVYGLAIGKFYPLFSFLFGVGMGLQILRMSQRGEPPQRLLLRRQLALMVIGLAHALLLWSVDILFLYALVGLVALLCRNLSDKTLRTAIVALYGIPIFFGVASLILAFAVLGTAVPPESEAPFGFLAGLEQRALATYRDGTWIQIFVWRAVEWLIVLGINLSTVGLQILALFLLGMYCARKGFFTRLQFYRRFLRTTLIAGLAAGLPANLFMGWAELQHGTLWPSFASTLMPVIGPLLTAGYVSGLILLAQLPRMRRWLRPLMDAGRMALTNYLMQSLVCTFLFYSYGFALYGSVGAAAGLALSVAIWLLQLPLSSWWFSRFQFGPMEWLWRKLTYGRTPAMKRTVALN